MIEEQNLSFFSKPFERGGFAAWVLAGWRCLQYLAAEVAFLVSSGKEEVVVQLAGGAPCCVWQSRPSGGGWGRKAQPRDQSWIQERSQDISELPGERKRKQQQETRHPKRFSSKSYPKNIKQKEKWEKAEAPSFTAASCAAHRNSLSANMTDITGEECKLWLKKKKYHLLLLLFGSRSHFFGVFLSDYVCICTYINILLKAEGCFSLSSLRLQQRLCTVQSGLLLRASTHVTTGRGEQNENYKIVIITIKITNKPSEKWMPNSSCVLYTNNKWPSTGESGLLN